MPTFKYIIDVDSHDFLAHVEDIHGDTIFEVTSYEHLQSLIEIRYMHHKGDLIGLGQYLIDQYIICNNDIVFTEIPLVTR